MKHLGIEVLFIIVGGALIIFRKWLVDGSIEFQDRVYGFHVGGKKLIGIYYLLVLIMGLVAIVLGILGLLGIAK